MKMLNPLKIYENLKDVYIGYLETFWETKYKDLNDKLSQGKDPERYINGPFLQLSLEYKKGKTIEQLVEEGILHPELKNIYPKLHLRQHQEDVILNIVKNKRNTLISTGTASGKTKAFLIPIFDYILKLKDELKAIGRDTKGVKAIIIYPMNALVNDQLQELRNTLSGTGITFGRYTGDTPYTIKDVDKKEYKNLKKQCPEELITREEILEEIPDILITNYSMLEFLLLRPKDTPLFEHGLWKFIVLDEIHVYDGAKGTEIGYLLRRLKVRAFRENPLCIGASATMGSGTEEDLIKSAKFAEKLFGEPFSKEDVILPVYWENKELDNTTGFWYAHLDFVEILKKYYKLDNSDFKKYIQNLINELSITDRYLKNEIAKATEKEVILFEFFKKFEGYKLIREYLKKEKVVHLKEFISSISTKYEPPLDEEQLIAFIDLLYKAQKKTKSYDNRLLDVKFHIFIRSLEGVFGTLDNKGRIENVFFQKKLEHEGKKVYQLTTCKNCGEVFLTGYKKRKSDGKVYLEIEPEFLEDPFRLEIEGKRTFIYLTDTPLNLDDEIKLSQEDFIERNFDIETGCLNSDERKNKSFYAYELTLEDSQFNQPKKCPSCGIDGKLYKKGRWISFFTPPDEYPQAVSLESIYKDLVDASESREERKIIVFSDSRKDAAFFAPFFEKFYNERLSNQIIYNQIKSNKNPIFLDILAEKCKNCVLSAFYKKTTNKEKQEEIEKFKKEILKDFMLFNEEALEEIGLVKYLLDEDIEANILSDLKKTSLKNYLSDEELKNFIYYVYRYIRKYKITNHFHNIFKGFTRSIWKEGTPPAIKRTGEHSGIDIWIPKKTGYMFRLLKKILTAKINGEIDNDLVKNILREIFPALIENQLGSLFILDEEKGYVLDEQKVFDTWSVKEVKEIYRCNTCRKLTPWNVNNICPQDKCRGKLEKINNEEVKKSLYLKKLFKNLNCKEVFKKKVKAREHTAQLSTKYGRDI
ncbi:MAG: DEAD/DEAH box helicase, partial [Aquificae bacterium]|nr:DEAD/DEAH box helicase [Aquificota bacterium]